MTAKKTKIWRPTIGAPLGPQERKLRDALHGRAASVMLLFRAVMGLWSAPAKDMPTLRAMHQKIGGIAARYNRKRKSPRIVPGDLPNTYRLRRVR